MLVSFNTEALTSTRSPDHLGCGTIEAVDWSSQLGALDLLSQLGVGAGQAGRWLATLLAGHEGGAASG